MASIKIRDLISQSFTSDLTDSDLKNINGGGCVYDGIEYSQGAVVLQSNGFYYKCNERVWPFSDQWEVLL